MREELIVAGRVFVAMVVLLAVVFGIAWGISSSCTRDVSGSREELGVIYKVIYDSRVYEATDYLIDSDGTLTMDTWYVCSRKGCYEKDTRVIMPAGTYIIEVRND